MKFYLHASFLFIISLLNISDSLAQGVSMSPTRIFFSGQPGETLTQKVILSNTSASNYVFNINKKDWKREEDGNKIYFTEGKLPNSNAAWVSTVESTIALPAGSQREIIVTMKVPANASQTDVTNSMLFFTQIGSQEDKQDQKTSIGIITLFEFGLHVYYTPPQNGKQSLEIADMKDVQQDGGRKALISIINDGNLVCDGSVDFELTNKETGAEVKLQPVNISMMPGATQTVSFNFPTNLKGKYLGVAIIKMAGNDDLRVGEKAFDF